MNVNGVCAMRTARASDYWRQACRQNYNNYVDIIEYSNLQGLGAGKVHFGRGISAICGANGVGKTTLLNAVLGVIDPEALKRNKGASMRLVGANIKAIINQAGVQTSNSVNISDSDDNLDIQATGLSAVWIDYNARLKDIFTTVEHLDAFLEGLDPFIVPNEEREELSNIIGKDYSDIRMFEVEIDDGTVPYFLATSDEIQYGITAMGLGEIAIFNIYLHLQKAMDHSVILIEEPESFIATSSQGKLMDMLAKTCCEKKVSIILTTHSPSILKSVPSENVVLLTRLQGKVHISKHTNKGEYLKILGMPSQKTGMILVEDRAAREFALAWIAGFDPILVQEFDIIDLPGGTSKISEQLKAFPKTGDWLKVIGLFDGDMRHLNEEYGRPYTFLPGAIAPEKLLMEVAYSEIEKVAHFLFVSEARVYTVLASLEGRDHHDWLEDFHKNLPVPYEHAVRALFAIWLTNNSNYKKAKSAFDELVRIIGTPLEELIKQRALDKEMRQERELAKVKAMLAKERAKA